MRRNSKPGVLFCLLLGLAALHEAAAQPAAPDFKLPVSPNFDLSHVEPAHYAVALRKDPVRIFEFVRDHVRHEAYAGALRGPRGALWAMAGNSVDRASLLASLLNESGQRVQFVRGVLPRPEARRLVDSMWIEHPQPAGVPSEPPPDLKAVSEAFMASVKSDYGLIRDHLRKANIARRSQPATSLDALVEEVQEHYWLQWWKDGQWVDLDPSFADAAPGRRYASIAQSFDSLPEALYHRVAFRILLEEHTGDERSTRVILAHSARAADVSGANLLLSHQPENWKGPATSLQSALAAAFGDTGRVKPVLIVGARAIIGEAFRRKATAAADLGIAGILGGGGAARPVALATAETLEFEFTPPGEGGRKVTIAREIFDIFGKARRSGRAKLTADEIRAHTESAAALDVVQSIYSIFITAGRIEAAHLAGAVEGQPQRTGSGENIDATLRRINIAFAAAADALLPRAGSPDRSIVLFYPDSPRVQIAELAVTAGKGRFALDLRRDHARALAMGPRPEDVFFARVLRGVIDATLERILVESIFKDGGTGWSTAVSTSSVFERAKAENVNAVLLATENSVSDQIPEEARARVRQALGNQYLVLAPERAIKVNEAPRFAWWQIDPRSGETIGVTEDGLHQGAVEYFFWEDKELGLVAVQRDLLTGRVVTVPVHNLEAFIRLSRFLGHRWVPGGYGSLGVARAEDPEPARLVEHLPRHQGARIP